jgi:transcriptional regulator with XRE-family HTH domain
MMEHTDLGRMINGLIGEADITQGKLAKALGISPSMLSNYLSGKNIPAMELIEKCRNIFNLKNGEIKDIFTKTFLSSAQNNHMIHLDTRFFTSKRLDLLVKVILVLMLYPENPDISLKPFDTELRTFGYSIFDYYQSLNNKVDYRPPAQNEKDNAASKSDT